LVQLWREPVSTTPWAVATLIDRLVSEYGVATLANVGNLATWNVSKTGLVNELRDHPEDCFVLGDLSAESAEGLRTRIPRFDAVLVLDPLAFPPGAVAAAPGLNRAQSVIADVIRTDPGLKRVDDLAIEGIPPMSVYTRRRDVSGADPRMARGARAMDRILPH
jgi:hypothetical protein